MRPLEVEAVVGEALARLAIARGALVDAYASEVYLDSLQDLDAELVRQACFELGQEPRTEFDPAMPAVGTIRTRAHAIANEVAERERIGKLLPGPNRDENDPRTWVHCRDCRDEPSAWRLRWCSGSGDLARVEAPQSTGVTERRHCGRSHVHAPHTWAERCPCYETNPVIARKRAARTQRDEQKRAARR